uniref:Uncharacterized protein n=1 Tax=Rhizophora mucronata TaxID=61149 RepID=A0A2P2P6L1_RHIMU
MHPSFITVVIDGNKSKHFNTFLHEKKPSVMHVRWRVTENKTADEIN